MNQEKLVAKQSEWILSGKFCVCLHNWTKSGFESNITSHYMRWVVYMFIHCRPRWCMASKKYKWKITSDHMSVFDSINCYSTLYYKKNHIWTKFSPCEVRLARIQLPVVKSSRVRVHRYRKCARGKDGRRDRVGSFLQDHFPELLDWG